MALIFDARKGKVRNEDRREVLNRERARLARLAKEYGGDGNPARDPRNRYGRSQGAFSREWIPGYCEAYRYTMGKRPNLAKRYRQGRLSLPQLLRRVGT